MPDVEAELGSAPANRECMLVAVDALANAVARAVLATPPAALDPQRVAVAMSGGVDSAVALLKVREAGFEPVGVTLRLWIDPEAPDSTACCSPQSVRAARAACHALGVGHVGLDLRDDFRRVVVDEFVSEYGAGRTPNPCVRCNGSFRFDALPSFADRVGAGRIATGHYARAVTREGRTWSARAADANKDQSYMLARVAPEILARTWFPLGRTDASRRRASRRTPPAWRPAGRPRARRCASSAAAITAEFVERYGGAAAAGDVVDLQGRVIGHHDGIHRFTPGQRRGVGVAANSPST